MHKLNNWISFYYFSAWVKLIGLAFPKCKDFYSEVAYENCRNVSEVKPVICSARRKTICHFESFCFHLVFTQLLCRSSSRKVHATMRLILFPCPIGIVLTAQASAILSAA